MTWTCSPERGAGVGDEVIHAEHGFLMAAVFCQRCGTATPVAVPEKNLRADVDSSD